MEFMKKTAMKTWMIPSLEVGEWQICVLKQNHPNSYVVANKVLCISDSCFHDYLVHCFFLFEIKRFMNSN